MSTVPVDELALTLRALDKLGHLEAEISLQRVRYDSQGNYRPLKVSGGFEFEPGQLAPLRAECKRWLDSGPLSTMLPSASA